MRFDIITIFPKAFDSYLSESIIKRAREKKLVDIRIHNLRDFTTDKHQKVDGRPYGGGPGMVFMVEPIYRALKALKAAPPRTTKSKRETRVVMLAPEGKQLTQREAERLSKYKRIVLICGRYEGFDSRVDTLVDEKISIGPYVLAGGELPAMVLLETVARNIPGVVGHPEALKEETFSKNLEYVEYPQYTRPEVFRLGSKKLRVPKVLKSGDHAAIRAWRSKWTRRSCPVTTTRNGRLGGRWMR
ncbi:tRNA (guanosine(37)-N1)-methyltransferase TrmD [Candidatus Parcubacteria bacterium]|nr:tRNA (guanosine(37)-N1)-methyltransferase TrmD [Candidatus Parcubacteria bacterium]